jgi:carbonic anhydrase
MRIHAVNRSGETVACNPRHEIARRRWLLSTSLAPFTWYTGLCNASTSWTYQDTWGGLCKDGVTQSPINISSAESVDSPDTTVIGLYSKQVKGVVVNNGHGSPQINFDPGNYLEYNKERYQLVQAHFHCPGEHTIDKEGFVSEIHLVHFNEKSKKTLVIAVLLQYNDIPNGLLQAALEKIPPYGEQGIPITHIHLEDVVPSDSYYTYTGSLTTPPCSEPVVWLVRKSFGSITEHQVKELVKKAGGDASHNARLVQRLGDRVITNVHLQMRKNFP